MGKAHKLPFGVKFEKSFHIVEIIRSDVMGKLEFSYPDGFQYVCTFLVDNSRYTFIVFPRHYDEVPEACEMVLQKLGQSRISKLKLATFSSKKTKLQYILTGQKSTNRFQNELERKTWRKLSLVPKHLSTMQFQKE